jgi:hypothetical protein
MYLKYSSETATFYQNLFAMRNTADVAGDKPIAILLQSISGVSAINLLVAVYDMWQWVDGPAVSAFGVWSRKLSNYLKGQS